ncbi:Oidioi.mRNA.OKI2018_I69.PAR.g10419.t1.cds [Oikopleura dioica]|uniref:Dynactin subunit 4 n=1 Tax=Oikopleura dioica TaxID=34765 RepID=A0ABN7RUJ6_OIKDI|nr:Oidioi.mRNA.OKI2018_I69.PAR.g10419.t1.cds [Oikopleura dioica]
MLLNISLRDDGQKKKQVELENPETRTLEEMEGLPEEYLSEDGLDFWKTTSLKQRFDQPEHQPELTKDLYPRRLTMGVKRSLRCRKCDHNLLKPEFSPSSIKFKMHLIATSFIPEIRLFKPSEFSADGLSAQVYLTVTNPTHSPMNIILLPFCDELPEDERTKRNFPVITGKIMLPTDSYEIPAKDTLLDYSCLTKTTENLPQSEDGKIVLPQPNKVAFNCVGLLNFMKEVLT